MKKSLRTVVIVLLSIGLLALFLRGAHLDVVWTEIRHANAWLIGLSAAVTVLTMVLRALRWQYLLEPIGHARFGPAFRTTTIGFAASAVLPARAGEVIRPYLLARQEGLSATATFATIIIERRARCRDVRHAARVVCPVLRSGHGQCRQPAVLAG